MSVPLVRSLRCMSGTLMLRKTRMTSPIRLGVLGTDSSHLIEFSRRIKALHDAGQTRCLVTQFWTDGRHDMPAADVEKWEAATLGLGATRAASKDAMLDDVDGALVLAVNGHRHLDLALASLERGLPTYVDKPLTCDLGEAKRMLAAARKSDARCYSASSLRFAAEVVGLPRDAIGDVVAIDATGPGELNASMEGLFFYGVHTIEMVDALFGRPGVARVRAITTPTRDLVDLAYADGRSAHLRLERGGSYDFAATVHGTKSLHQFKVNFAGVYDRLVEGMCRFFEGGAPPATLAGHRRERRRDGGGKRVDQERRGVGGRRADPVTPATDATADVNAPSGRAATAGRRPASHWHRAAARVTLSRVKPANGRDQSGNRPLHKRLMPVVPESGRPLYASVRDSLRAAIDNGVFKSGEQMPSTKELSEQMAVSLVTAHRALQELVSVGVLQRSQGKGTFIHERYPLRKNQISDCRVGLMIHREASLADYYHGQILEGVRRESDRLNIDLILLRFGEDVRNECNGFLYLNPMPDEIAEIEVRNRRQATVVIGARGTSPRLGSVDVDNVDLGRQAVDHVANLGHRRVMLVSGFELNSNSRDRRAGFLAACDEHRIAVPPAWLFSGGSWRLTDDEQAQLVELLRQENRPTAVFAAGYYMALDVYSAAAHAGLSIPGDLSIISVDDPPSAEHLSPALSTMRQPLVQVGEVAIATLLELIRREDVQASARTLRAELVARGSTARPT